MASQPNSGKPQEPAATGSRTLPATSYTVAWICALHIEMAAARAMLDEMHADLPSIEGDINNYALGSIGRHHIVIACLPEAQYGTNRAASVLTNLVRTFTSIRLGLMVGIGGGAPSSKDDVRLGDVVVGTRVMPYELGKVASGGQIQHTAVHKTPHQLLGTLVSKLRSNHEEDNSRMPKILEERLATRPKYQHPGLPDELFEATYDHDDSLEAPMCDGCDRARLVVRRERANKGPEVHYGGIASGDKVMRHGATRDEWARRLNAICFEMEAAGLMDILPCLPIRGICDYSDTHKNKAWQRYAAATAAAYARELLEVLGISSAHYEPRNNTRAPPTSAEQRAAFMAALKFEQMDARKTIIGTAHARTCRWFLQSPAFQEWQNPRRLSDHHGFLWIRGKPGAGKSTLMKFLYQESKNTDRSGSSLTIASFFNARGHALEKSVSGMYRSLILQLFHNYIDMQTVLDGIYFDHRKRDHVPSTDVLKEVLREGIRKLGQRSLRCFIDALDEGDEQQIIEMVHYFEEIAGEGVQKGIDFKICFSSRHYPYIDVDHGVRLTLEDELGHADDLSTYIRSHLRINSLVPVANLEAQLLEKARGVFLWVVLVVAMLNKEARHGGFAILKRLREIPSGLSDLFQDILSRDKDHIPEFLLCMTWILFSKRPMKPSEFHHAMWSSLAMNGLADEHVPDTTTPGFEEGARLSIISSSKGLAEVTKPPTAVVQFIHESVRDFLIKDNGLAELFPEFGESQGHNRLKEACMFYFKLHGGEAATRSNLLRFPSARPVDILTLHCPFLDYAVRYVLSHSDDAAQYSPQDTFLSSFPTRRWSGTMNFCLRETSSRLTPPLRDDSRLIYVLGSAGCANLIRTRLRQSADYNGHGDEEYRYPLFAAVKSGSWRAVAAMLECTPFDIADVRVMPGPKGLLVGSEHNRYTPLTWAIMSRCIDVAFFLVRQGAQNLEVDEDGNTPLCLAAAMGEARIAEALIQAGVDLNAPDGCGSRPLQSATWFGHVSIAQRLIQSGVDVNASDSYGDRCIHLAAENGDKTLCQMLVQAGAEVNTPNGFGKTPLYLALEHGKEEVVNFLLESGVHVNAWDSNGDLPLCVASKNGHQHVVKRLIELGAHVDAPNILENRPLCLALENSHWEIAHLVIHLGAAVNATDAAKRTPLYYASMHGLDTIVTCLIDSGVDVNARFADGHLPTSLALSQGHLHTARLLLVKGAVLDGLAIELLILLRRLTDPTPAAILSDSANVIEQVSARLLTGYMDSSARDSQGHGPLHLAIARGSLSPVRELIQKGADVNARTLGGPRPLHVAVMHDRRELAKVLIDSGADVNGATFNGTRAIHLACFHHRVGMARLLIANGADTMIRNVEGLTPLHMAASEGVVELLVGLGVDVNARSADGSTPLHRAARFAHLDVCTALVKGRAFVNRRDGQKRTPVAVAMQLNSNTVGSRLLNLGGIL